MTILKFNIDFVSTLMSFDYSIDIKNVDKQLTLAMHVKDRYTNGTFIDKLTKWHQ